MTRTRGVALALVLLGPAWGCGDSEAPGEAPAVVATTSTEAQPDRPRLDREAIVLTEAFRLAPAGLWSEALDVAVDGEGNVYVLDAVVPSNIHKFDPTGRHLLRFGQDEPDPPMTLAQRISLAPEWNTIVAVDRPESVLRSFLTLGVPTYSVSVTPGTAIDALAMPGFGEYYLHGWDQARSRSGVYHMRLPIDTLATTYEVAIPVDQTVGKIARDVYFRTAVDRRGRLYVGFHDGYPVRVLEASGRTVALIGLEREPVARTPEEIASKTAENLAKLRERIDDVPDSLLTEAARVDSVLSMIEELAVDPAGRLWVRTNRADAPGSTYDVFDDRGRYLARVDVPGEVEASTFAPDGRLFVIDSSGEAAGVVIGYDVRL